MSEYEPIEFELNRVLSTADWVSVTVDGAPDEIEYWVISDEDRIQQGDSMTALLALYATFFFFDEAAAEAKGHIQEYVEYYIQSQEMTKEHESNEVVEDVDEGEQGETPPLPDPP